MTNYFEVNGNKYAAKAFTFNTICDLEEMGVALSDAKKKTMSVARAYFAICANMDAESAGQELEQHVINGGSFDGIMKAMVSEMEKSDFFRTLNQTATAKATASEIEKK